MAIQQFHHESGHRAGFFEIHPDLWGVGRDDWFNSDGICTVHSDFLRVCSLIFKTREKLFMTTGELVISYFGLHPL